ncbi:MAG: FumA C-terminus/TtdB family hydratase beta subunit [Endomicrobium sp.]|jgi:fumarate hydratase subunit beta|nr:FumA C-terminus/TtdB family hydratase beta subunit [Endomicrobium sp.]
MNVSLDDLIFNLNNLKVRQRVLFSGTIYTARDAAHKRIIDLLDSGNKDKIPFNLNNSAVYYCGPTPTKPGNIVGACGPTTSSRMDIFTPRLLKEGVKVLIGKGNRSKNVEKSIEENKAIYFIVTGGVGALISKSVVKADLIAFEDLGPEAVYRFEVKNIPLVVAIDSYGSNIFFRG